MLKKLLGGGLVIFLLGFGYWALYRQKSMQPSISPSEKVDEERMVFRTPVKSPHWVSNTPDHGSYFATVPNNIVIDVNFDLALPSSISITKDGREYGIDSIRIDTNKLAMRRVMSADAPDGIYAVRYQACWPDGSCHDGMFEFGIDRRLANSFEDHRATADVTISLKDTAFLPKKIRVSKNTRVTWLNNDSIGHYINTDPHPAHTYLPQQNSKALKRGEAYAVVFTQPGEYPYHCSAHAQTMTGSILVE